MRVITGSPVMYLYVGGNGAVVAISPDDGREAWRTSLVEVEKKKFFTISGIDYGVTILEHEARVFALNTGRLHALDAATGEILWSFEVAEGKAKVFGVTLSISGKSVRTESSYSGIGISVPPVT
jgi:outer membrane protein assembly factor BamB